MNIKKIEKQLKKINQLLSTIKEDGSFSSIEKDLMLDYVRGLYVKVKDAENDEYIAPEIPAPVDVEPIIQIDPVIEAVKSEVQTTQEAFQNDDYASNEETKPSPTPPTVKSEEIVEQIVEEVAVAEAPTVVLNLFKSESINELSDKLSRAPITDLTKCMGINEKIFTVKELFGDDSMLFSNTMESLDKLDSLEQARDYLVEHVAVAQDWGNEEKLKKAAHFIKLISRRY